MPAEEGQETTLTCTVNTAVLACSSSTILEWSVNKLTSVIECISKACGGGYSSSYGFSATISLSSSTLTIPKVSRIDPFNMETRWTCRTCADASREVTACDKLEVYAKPENPSCTVRENTAASGDIETVTVSCSTTKVYPEAKCSFERRTNGGTPVTINKTPTYNHTELTGKPVYYRSECSVDVPVAELGEGTHSFRAFIYPDVTDGIDLVTATTASTTVTLKPPPHPPKIIIKGKTYQGVNVTNMITLAAGYTGDMTCRAEGGYPKAHTTQLTCGSLTASGGESVATLTFLAGQLNRRMDGIECRCTSQHVTGSYSNNEASLTLDIHYAPVVTSFSHNSGSSEFNEGDTPTFTCTAQGNPPPNLVITRKGIKQQLASVQGNLELTYTVDPLDCLDTDVYICNGQNDLGVTTTEINIMVKCPQHLASNINLPGAVKVALGENAKVDFEIYGFPTPRLLTLMRATDSTNQTGSARHLIEYSPGRAPFGFVNVTISDVREEDFTNYTITVDNGEGDPLVYSFYLEEKDQDDNTLVIAVSVAAAAAVILVVVILMILVPRCRGSRKLNTSAPARETSDVNVFRNSVAEYDVTIKDPEGKGQHSYADFESPQQENENNGHISHANMGYSNGEENRVHMKTAGRDIDDDDVYMNTPRQNTDDARGFYNNTPGQDMDERNDVYNNTPGQDTDEANGIYNNTPDQDTNDGNGIYNNTPGQDMDEGNDVYNNTPGPDTDEANDIYNNTPDQDTNDGNDVYNNTPGQDTDEANDVYNNTPGQDTDEESAVYVNIAGLAKWRGNV
ncbi:kin of irre protein [Plakobranchus ocellatus]|uniref:Kin of irre protein n=1 Tax=Plakobranchus ocellatus TaxID=259542 RepID=A0AAV4C8G6_9GAST|nr:kin of irre protein [Plakobranchus ocellatus]